jgi:hypothetical protein
MENSDSPLLAGDSGIVLEPELGEETRRPTRSRNSMNTLAFLLLWIAQGDSKHVENPEYRGWSACKPGAWVRSRVEHESNGMSYRTESTSKLIESDGERAVIELTTRENSTGARKESEPVKVTIPARVTEAERRRSQPGITLQAKPKEGAEELEIGGLKVKCRWEEFETGDSESGERYKIWRSEEIPGGVAKWELTQWDSRPPIGSTARFLVEAWALKPDK